MTKAAAIEIFNNLGAEEYSTLEKMEAIIEVSQLEKINNVTKVSMHNAIQFLLEVLKDTIEDN